MKIETSELHELVSAIEDSNLSIPEVIARIKGDGNSATELVEENIILTVDYSCTLQGMIDAGNYAWQNSDITEKHFPLPAELSGQKTTISSKLFHFDRDISSKDAISEMEKAGYRPATLAELLALGEAHPELQKEFPIVALGSVWRVGDGVRLVPVLGFDGDGRGLGLGWLDDGWDVNYRFFGVRK